MLHTLRRARPYAPRMRTHSRLLGAAFIAVASAGILAGCTSEATPAADAAPASSSTSTAATEAAVLAPTADAAGASAASAEYAFPTGPAVLVEPGYEAPTDRVDSTGAYLPVNGKPTLVLVEAIWCPNCALTRPIFQRLRPEYQDDVNLVVLDFDLEADAELARSLGAWAHPAWAVIAPDSNEVLERRFGPLNEPNLRALLDGVRDGHIGS